MDDQVNADIWMETVRMYRIGTKVMFKRNRDEDPQAGTVWDVRVTSHIPYVYGEGDGHPKDAEISIFYTIRAEVPNSDGSYSMWTHVRESHMSGVLPVSEAYPS